MLLLLPLLLFTTLLVPFLGVVPYLDGDVEFKIAYNFYTGNYLTNWMPYHPPLKPLLASVLFSFFGVSAYTFLGLLLGLVGILSIYSIGLTLFDKKTAGLSALFLALSGIYVATALFSLNDFVMTVFFLLAFALYVRGKFFLYAIAISLAVCSKESAIIFPLCILIVELLQKKVRFEHVIPFFIVWDWIFFLHITGHSLWNAWNFSSDSPKGILPTFLDNIFQGKLFNTYAYSNWLHLFFFNYNWVFWLLAIAAGWKLKKNQYFLMMVLFFFCYAGIILSFQTYTITQYILPILPFVYLLASYTLMQLLNAKCIAITAVIFIAILSLFTSDDPVANVLWKKTTLLQRNFYVNKSDGLDGITYNMQFLQIAKERDAIIRDGKNTKLINSLNVDHDTFLLYHLTRK